MKKWPPTTRSWQKWAGSVAGVGFLPIAPGTWGTAAGVLALLPFLHWSGGQMFPILAPAAVLASWIGARAARDLAPDWGEDPKQFVLDEVAGVWVAMLGHPVDLVHLLAAFVLFRVFDIWKPMGIRRLESAPHGWGVMLDDLAAGAVTNVLLRLI